ncbi:phage capsid protein [Clostridia bacterium]|nr:phage capsid protein [Clostridia bacterium]
MSRILELREKRAKAWDQAKSFLDASTDENGLVSPENAERYARMETEITAQGEQIKRLEQQAAIDAEMSAPTRSPILTAPHAGVVDAKPGRASSEYKTAFWSMMRAHRGSFEVSNALHIGTQEGGGYLVPDEYERTLIQALQEENIFRKLAHIIQTSSGDRKIPVVASKGSAQWVDEEAQIPESDDSFGQVSLGAHKLATMLKVSDELLNDNVFNLEAYITKEFARRIGTKEEESFFIGNGASKPHGLLSPTAGAQTGVTLTSQTAITFDDVIDLFYSLGAPYRAKSVFICHDGTVKNLRKLKDSSGQYLWAPSIKEGTPDTLLNRPLYTSIYMPTIAAGAKPMLFGDLNYYWLADRQGRSFKRLNELFASTGQVGYLASQRVDGRLILPEAVKTLTMGGTPPVNPPSGD